MKAKPVAAKTLLALMGLLAGLTPALVWSQTMELVRPDIKREIQPLTWVTWEQALDLNKQEETSKPILLFLAPPWCENCDASRQSFAENTYMNDAAQRFHLVEINPEERPGFWAYAVTGFPTLAPCLPDGLPLFGINTDGKLVRAARNASGTDYQDMANWLSWIFEKATGLKVEAENTAREAYEAQKGDRASADLEALALEVERALVNKRDWTSGYYGNSAKRPSRAPLKWATLKAMRDDREEDARFLLLSRYRVARLMGPSLEHLMVRETATRDFRSPIPLVEPAHAAQVLTGLAETLAPFPDQDFRGALEKQLDLLLNSNLGKAPYVDHVVPLLKDGTHGDSSAYTAEAYLFADGLLQAGAILGNTEGVEAGKERGDQLWKLHQAGPLPHSEPPLPGIDFFEAQLAGLEYWAGRARLTGEPGALDRAKALADKMDSHYLNGRRPFGAAKGLPPFAEVWKAPEILLCRLALSLAHLNFLTGEAAYLDQAKATLSGVSPTLRVFSSQDQAYFLLALNAVDPPGKVPVNSVKLPRGKAGDLLATVSTLPPQTRVYWQDGAERFEWSFDGTTSSGSLEELSAALAGHWKRLEMQDPKYVFLP